MPTTFPRQIAGYDVPNCLDSSDDFDRVQHRDLPSLEDRQLVIEKIRVEAAIARAFCRRYCVRIPTPAAYMHADEWLVRRLAAVTGEMRMRKASRR